jgi:superfamily II DNA/RNA helicase
MCADAATAAAARRDTAVRGREGPIRIGGRRSERGETLSTHDTTAGTPDADTNGSNDTNDVVETETEFAAHAVEIDHSTSGAPDEETAEELAARAPVTESNPLFSALGVRRETVEALESVGITRAFAIQELTLPIALGGSDVIGQARTGTGKTLGFGIPILQRVLGPDEGADGVPQALVVVPTRELCVQVTRDIEAAGRTRGVRVMSVYGGRAYEPQIATLRTGVDVVVGTPGRLIDLAERGDLVLGKVRILVLDEADEMLDLGFLPDIEKILKMIPDHRQTMLFSATMPGPIVTLARQFMKQPVHIRAEEPDEGRTVPEVDQFIYRAHALDKIEMLARILQARERGLVMVFCRTKRTAQKVSDELVLRGFASAAVHGDLGQGAREQALRAFRAGKVDVLVATDVAARGIDVSGVTHVVNYQCPEEEKTYLHRIGRTGRAGASGVAVTFADWDDVPRWQLINKTLDLPFTDPPETYSTSEHLYTDLDIPTSATGTLPRGQRTRAGLGAETLEDLGETGKSRRSAKPKAEEPAAARTRSRRAEGDAEDATRPKKTRRRTRGGESADATAAVTGTATATATATATDAEPAPTAEGEAGSGAPRRRRRRGGRGRGAAGGEAPAAEATPES